MTLAPLTQETLSALLTETSPPCVSLYQPTHRQHPENQQDIIRYRNLVKQIEQTLNEQHPADLVNALIEPFHALAEDDDFWQHTLDGLAVFGAPGLFHVFGLQRTVQELAVVAGSFHTKPLRRFLQSTDRYQLLGLSLQEARLYEGNRDGLHAIKFVPDDAPDEDGGAASKAKPHTQGGRQNEAGTDETAFFRAIDRAVLEQHSRPSSLPLILAALPEHHGLFREISHNPFLLVEGVKINPEALSPDEFCARAWQVFEPQYHTRLAALADDFAVAKSKGLGLEDLEQVAEAAVAGRVDTLLIEADRQIAGRIHAGTGNLHLAGSDTPPPDGLEDDLLDDLGEWVLKMGGRVMVVPAAQMPVITGAAATCRY